MKSEPQLPRSAVARASVVGAAAVKVSAKKAQSLLAEPFRKESERAAAAERTDQELAKVLFDTCSVLRGTALKLAQVLATEHEMLPPAFREQFARASYQAIPIPRPMVRRIVKNELGDWRAHFATFSDIPFAAASLGQVHAATSLAGDSLAVKLQYPGVPESVASDLRLLRMVLARSRWGQVFETCFDELRERLNEELDYEREAENTTWFREHVGHPSVVVPRVYRDHSTKHVLVTERMDGLHLAEWLASAPPQELRQHYGQVLVDLFHHSIFDLHRIHADPNLGNYLFRNDGCLGLIDFGCVRQLDEVAVQALRSAYTVNLQHPEAIQRIHADLGVTYRSDVSAERLGNFLREWAAWISEPSRSERFDFGKGTDYFERGAELGKLARQMLGRFDGPFLYFARAHQGLFRILQTLGVSVSMKLPD